MTNDFVEFIYCVCGCGLTRSKYNAKGELARYIRGHTNKGKHHTEEHRHKIGDAQRGEKHHFYGKKLTEEHKKKIRENAARGEKNPKWVGNNFKTLEGLHYRIRTQLPRPLLCEICKVCSPQELSNKNHKYSMDLSDWQWLCKRCHRDYDNNYEKNFKKANEERKRLKKLRILAKLG